MTLPPVLWLKPEHEFFMKQKSSLSGKMRPVVTLMNRYVCVSLIKVAEDVVGGCCRRVLEMCKRYREGLCHYGGMCEAASSGEERSRSE